MPLDCLTCGFILASRGWRSYKTNLHNNTLQLVNHRGWTVSNVSLSVIINGAACSVNFTHLYISSRSFCGSCWGLQIFITIVIVAVTDKLFILLGESWLVRIGCQ